MKLDDYKEFPVGLPMAGSIVDPDSQGYVYVVGFEEPGVVKVGSARVISLRLDQMQTGNPFRLHLIGAVSIYDCDPCTVEREAHKRLKDCRIRGEWFDIEADDAIRHVIEAAKTKRTRYGSWAAAYRKTQVAHLRSIEGDERDRIKKLRVKLGMD